MKPDKYKLTQYKNRFKEKVKPIKKNYNEYTCSECNCPMGKSEFMIRGGICVDCTIIIGKELIKDILMEDDE